MVLISHVIKEGFIIGIDIRVSEEEDEEGSIQDAGGVMII